MMSQAQQKGALVPATIRKSSACAPIAQRIIPNTPRWNQESAQQWKWQVNLVESDQVNAFCMPGGRIGFFTGIIDKLKLTDDEIAAVMGHEIAHALREHGRDRQARPPPPAWRLGAGRRHLRPRPGSRMRVTNMIGQLLVLKFSRDEEREADLVGLDISARAGYDPRAGIALWNKMAQLNKSGAPIELLSTHPGGSDPHRADIERAHERAAAAVRAQQGHLGRPPAALPHQRRR
jgi:predicted Zn-dependent protease